MNIDLNIVKTMTAFGVSGSAWIADTVTATPEGYWMGILKEVGLPTAMLGAAVYGLWHLSKKLSETESARVADQKEMLAQYRADMKQAAESRAELIREMKDQTKAIKDKP